MMQKVPAHALRAWLEANRKWTVVDGPAGAVFLRREYEFKNFSEAFAFLTRTALVAEQLEHHPTLTNTYNKVSLQVTTHDLGNQLSHKDLLFAERVSEFT